MLRYSGRSIVHYSVALKCTALLHEASDFLKLRCFSLPMEACDSCKNQVIRSVLKFYGVKEAIYGKHRV